MIAIYKRDLKGFFTGMMGYVLLAFFLAVGGLYFTVMNLMSGYPDLSYTLYNNLFVLLAPKGTDPAIIEKLNAAIMNVTEENEAYAQAVTDYSGYVSLE